MQLTDTHCHLYFRDYKTDLDAVLERAKNACISQILIPGIDLASSQSAINLAEDDLRLFASVGIHPNSSLTWTADTLEFLELMAENSNVVAVGEIGLDYYRERAPHGHQKHVFQEQLKLAERLNLPVVIHTRNASPSDRSCIDDTLKILEEFELNGVLHSFSGNSGEAQRIIEIGFNIGITGPVTFKKADELRDVVASVDIDRLLIETDGPFLTPHPHRGRRNEPAYVRFVAEKISEVRKQPLKNVVDKTTANAKRLFGW